MDIVVFEDVVVEVEERDEADEVLDREPFFWVSASESESSEELSSLSSESELTSTWTGTHNKNIHHPQYGVKIKGNTER